MDVPADKLLDALKSTPTWVLLGIALSALAIWFLPPIFDSVPDNAKWAVPVAALASGIFLVCKLSDTGISYTRARYSRRMAQDLERLNRLYDPIFAIFITCHVTTSSSILYPSLMSRIRHSYAELSFYERRLTCLRMAWSALFYRGYSINGVVDFGGNFPISEIAALLKAEAIYADDKLCQLTRCAHRSRYEEGGNELLTSEELELIQHVGLERKRLRRLLSR
ncbi:hypothetical protein WBO78_23925 [Bosea sp. CCNWLW174]|uniref:hypothetical protein n=1 Tax=unclassified Bosea (in: a-proteobacteria) TaxID=2653178 RepID=UPI003014A000